MVKLGTVGPDCMVTVGAHGDSMATVWAHGDSLGPLYVLRGSRLYGDSLGPLYVLPGPRLYGDSLGPLMWYTYLRGFLVPYIGGTVCPLIPKE